MGLFLYIAWPFIMPFAAVMSNNGMHPTRNSAALILNGNSGRVMPGVRWLDADLSEPAFGFLSGQSRPKSTLSL